MNSSSHHYCKDIAIGEIKVKELSPLNKYSMLTITFQQKGESNQIDLFFAQGEEVTVNGLLTSGERSSIRLGTDQDST